MPLSGAMLLPALYPDPPPAGANLSDPSTWNPTLPLEKLALVESTVIEACDGDDGLVDGLVGNPSTCNFDPATDFPMCESDIDPGDDSCLTSIEVEALKRIYNGPIASTESDADGFAFGGCEDQTTWKDWMVLNTTWAPQYYSVPNLGYSFAQEELRYFVYDDPEYDFRNFDLNDLNHLADLDSQTSVASAVDTDLSEFRNRGGKMIMYHGWCDPILSPYTTIKYFPGVADNQENYNGQSGEIQDFLRLFLAPGMLHCSGGPGPNGVDYLSALEAWVEEDVAPDALIATGGKVEDRTRPLCPHPQVAVWDGIGNTNDAASFNCQ